MSAPTPTEWYITCPDCGDPFAIENSDGVILCPTETCGYHPDEEYYES